MVPPPTKAHPRSRGEHVYHVRRRAFYPGSSPLARGTQVGGLTRQLEHRLIPARAGNTRAGRFLNLRSAAHPRSRGEHATRLASGSRRLGSSPLARGTRLRTLHGERLARLIPARAGNTPGSSHTASIMSAHPRSRGEHAGGVDVWEGVVGSSPLARGTPVFLSLVIIGFRLIPARAGNTCRRRGLRATSAAHPRSRGEHVLRA